MRTKCYFLVVLWLSSLLVQAQTTRGVSDKIDALFAGYNADTPGVSVGVLKDGEFVFKKNYGSANLEYDIPITGKSVFHVASVSKQFTAFAIYLLQHQNLLSLEDDVRKYLPELPDYGKEIKIRHLLAHTSGLREQFALLTLGGWNMTDNITNDQILKLAFAQKDLNFKSGSQLAYCNTGYTLLAEIVARVTGITFNEFCIERIFKPLSMTDTQFYDDANKVVKNRAYSYEVDQSRYVKKRLNFSMVGATSLFTTVEDLAKWANNYDRPIVGDENLFKEFNAVSKLDNGDSAIWRIIKTDTLHHAKGQFIRDYRGVQVYKHGGHDAGYRTFLARFPEEGFTIITLSNDEHYEIFARGMEIAEFYLADQLEEELDFVPRANEKTASETKYSTKDLEKYLGDFESEELDTRYHIVKDGNQLVMRHQRLRDIVLTQIGKDRFSGTNHWGFELQFTWSEKEVSGFEISNFGVNSLWFGKRE